MASGSSGWTNTLLPRHSILCDELPAATSVMGYASSMTLQWFGAVSTRMPRGSLQGTADFFGMLRHQAGPFLFDQYQRRAFYDRVRITASDKGYWAAADAGGLPASMCARKISGASTFRILNTRSCASCGLSVIFTPGE